MQKKTDCQRTSSLFIDVFGSVLQETGFGQQQDVCGFFKVKCETAKSKVISGNSMYDESPKSET